MYIYSACVREHARMHACVVAAAVQVVELVVVRDKATHESKGSAFVWYATRAHAERAILQFNLRHILSDPAGEQDRPLVVRKAKARAKGVHPSLSAIMVSDQTPRQGAPGGWRLGAGPRRRQALGSCGKLRESCRARATHLDGGGACRLRMRRPAHRPKRACIAPWLGCCEA